VVFQNEHIVLTASTVPGVHNTLYVLTIVDNSLQLLFDGPSLVSFISSMVSMAAADEVIGILQHTMLEVSDKLQQV